MSQLYLVDSFDKPSGIERFTNRPAWRVRNEDGEILWAFLVKQGNRIHVLGYPTHPVIFVGENKDPAAGPIAVGGIGAIIGGVLGGPPGALLGGIIGAILGTGVSK